MALMNTNILANMTHVQYRQRWYCYTAILQVSRIKLKVISLMNSIDTNYILNTLRPRQHGRHFPDDIFRCIFLNENVSVSIKISLKFVPKGQINNIPALV